MSDGLRDVFHADGPLARAIPGFAPRAAQVEMARAVAQTLADGGNLVAEAGTGTGKTFAYLVPALLSGKRIVVSTGTKNLQDQIFQRDLPAVNRALGTNVSTALLKGRANYLCLHRLAGAGEHARFPGRQYTREFGHVVAWSHRTRSGDINEIAEVPEDSPVWPWVTSTSDNCLGQKCAVFNDCFLTRARRAAQQADIVVVNHHLLCADLALRDEGYGEVLPGAHAYVIDEAHQLPQIATNFFGQTLGSRQLIAIAGDSVLAQKADARDATSIERAAEKLRTAVAKLRLAFGAEPRRAVWNEARRGRDVESDLAAVRDQLAALAAALEPHAERSPDLAQCHARCGELQVKLREFQEHDRADQLQWLETFTQSFVLNVTPIDIGPTLGELMARRNAAWVFTSATLAVGEDFSHFVSRVGVTQPRAQRWESPFDFPRQALLYLPRGLPEPAAPGYTQSVVNAAVPVLRASGGRAFMLFTSHRALQLAAGVLRGAVEFPLFIQGALPRTRLLDEFRASGNGVLLGTSSFWEGVDVRGDALSVVIIDKLPFAAPDEPLVRARAEALRARGENPFLDDQLPQAVIALKQGVGRLIRDVHDYGVLMLCDPRLTGKSYGKQFLDALPAMRRTHDAGDVTEFFESRAAPTLANIAL